jgi:amino acid transporter
VSAPPRLRRGLGAVTLAGTIFIFGSSGPFGLEAMVRDGGPGAAALMLVLTLLFWGLSHALVATELSSAVPEEGSCSPSICFTGSRASDRGRSGRSGSP